MSTPRQSRAGELVMEPGPIELSAGSSSSDIRSRAELTVTGETRVVRGDERAFLSVAIATPAKATRH